MYERNTLVRLNHARTPARAQVSEMDGARYPTVEGSDLPLRMPISSFAELSELPAKIIENCPQTPLQLEQYAAPILLAGRDLMMVGAAPRGADQVAPLILGLVGRVGLDDTPRASGAESTKQCQPRALCLVPSRALATYAWDATRALTHGTALRCACACGGVSIDASAADCVAGVDVLIATPGRLQDLLDKGAVSLSEVHFLALVGADALFDLGFEAQLRRVVLDEVPSPLVRQTMLSCSSVSDALKRVSPHLFKGRGPVTLTAAAPWLGVATQPLSRQTVHFADERGKQAALAALLSAGRDGPLGGSGERGFCPCSSLVLVSSRRQCEMIVYYLQVRPHVHVHVHAHAPV